MVDDIDNGDTLEGELSVLTERQRKIYLLRNKGATLSQIADTVGITQEGVRATYNRAKNRVWKYRENLAEGGAGGNSIELTLTRGELDLIIEALLLLEKDLRHRAGYIYREMDGSENCPYRIRAAKRLRNRALGIRSSGIHLDDIN